MKLVDFVKNLETRLATLPNSDVMAGTSLDIKSDFTIAGSLLKTMEKHLYECDEFKNVVRINFLNAPTFVIDNETQEPIDSNRNFIGGDTGVKSTQTFQFKEGEEVTFGKFVDLYSIRAVKVFNNKEDVTKPGVWIYPTIYDTNEFKKHPNQIRVIWDQEQLEQTLGIIGSAETPKARLIRMFSDALDSMEPNLPHDYMFFIRCSQRSIVLKDETAPSGSVVFSGSTNLYSIFKDSTTSSLDIADAGPK